MGPAEGGWAVSIAAWHLGGVGHSGDDNGSGGGGNGGGNGNGNGSDDGKNGSNGNSDTRGHVSKVGQGNDCVWWQ